jgi:hypothetical protein
MIYPIDCLSEMGDVERLLPDTETRKADSAKKVSVVAHFVKMEYLNDYS